MLSQLDNLKYWSFVQGVTVNSTHPEYCVHVLFIDTPCRRALSIRHQQKMDTLDALNFENMHLNEALLTHQGMPTKVDILKKSR